jgi:hypothetical protein
MSRQSKINYILKNSFLTKEELSNYDEYDINVIYKNVKAGVIYGISL